MISAGSFATITLAFFAFGAGEGEKGVVECVVLAVGFAMKFALAILGSTRARLTSSAETGRSFKGAKLQQQMFKARLR